jgi:hypothetical protein
MYSPYNVPPLGESSLLFRGSQVEEGYTAGIKFQKFNDMMQIIFMSFKKIIGTIQI